MIATLEKLCRALGRVAVVLLFSFLAVYGVAMGFALAGVRQPAETLGDMAWAAAFLFSSMFGLFLLTAFLAAAVRWIDQQRKPVI